MFTNSLIIFALSKMIMVGSNSHTLFLSLLLLASLVAVSEGLGIFTYRHVYVKNDLDNNTLLIAHCKSKNVDVGVQNLHYQEEFKFQFKPDFWGTTLYFCGLTWDGTLHWFDIYDQDRDNQACKDCKWSIQRSQPCRFNFKTEKYDLCDYKYH
ncbi:putative plant self-incompatibility S1 [Lupinus albus]|uniref:S-protein homolog n=1 Tax=Lupinus albus TaxID=3870 RepID=A0A6A4PSG8_LUPAL|nr:putative plant self-incompatibility S1 [Lupinus albus]